MPGMTLNYLTPERALIFRVTHMANLPWVLEHGLVCQNSPVKDPNFVRIGNDDVILKRLNWPVPIPPGGVLADYVPFYFTPRSIMMLNIITGYGEVPRLPATDLVILASSLPAVAKAGVRFVFTDSHARLSTARFSASLDDLESLVDWNLLKNSDFRHNPDDPGRKERYQAEALIHGTLPAQALTGLACSASNQVPGLEVQAASRGLSLKVIAKPEWFFQ